MYSFPSMSSKKCEGSGRDDVTLERLGDEVANARNIVRRGSSADFQLKVYKDALARGLPDHDAKVAVVDWLVEQTADLAGGGLANGRAVD